MVRKCRKAKGMVEAGYVRSGGGRRDNPAKDGAGISSTYMQLRSRRIVYVSVDCRSENPSYDNGVSSNLSCCASNEYSARSRNVVFDGGFIDLEEYRDGDTETSTYGRSRKRKLFESLRDKESSKPMENYPSIAADFESGIKESDTKAKESSDCCCSGRRSSSTNEHPTEAEIEEFFAEAEKQLQEKFKKKYNFDFDKEKPLQGRYEWVKLSE